MKVLWVVSTAVASRISLTILSIPITTELSIRFVDFTLLYEVEMEEKIFKMSSGVDPEAIAQMADVISRVAEELDHITKVNTIWN